MFFSQYIFTKSPSFLYNETSNLPQNLLEYIAVHNVSVQRLHRQALPDTYHNNLLAYNLRKDGTT